ncbi:MAG TPA: tetraacyldisaccharide 4'-kinase [Thermoanaerobaculia bacterium]|nr:tetraacyldisaccharide 4'-kinase [Thermoanaerobaculia bacterium]
MALAAPPPPRSPWQRLYGAAHRLRWRWYERRARRLPRPVVSVGNLCWGGAGKTPLVAAVAGHLRDRGLRVCVLSRGYGRTGGGRRIVSSGGGALLPATLAGDEPALLAEQLPGVAVVVGAARYQAGLFALERLNPSPDLFVLDDGFSHLALRRDLDLIAFPAADPFAGGRLWPGGNLREPLAAVARADAALATDLPPAGEPPTVGEDLALALRAYGFAGPGFASVTRPGIPLLAGDTEGGTALPLPAGSRVILVTAIARPERLAASVRGLDFAVVGELRFPDHHSFPPASLARIEDLAAATGAAAVLTTGKDRVKLQGRLGARLAELPIQAEPEPAFWAWLDAAIDRLRHGEAPRP